MVTNDSQKSAEMHYTELPRISISVSALIQVINLLSVIRFQKTNGKFNARDSRLCFTSLTTVKVMTLLISVHFYITCMVDSVLREQKVVFSFLILLLFMYGFLFLHKQKHRSDKVT